MRASSLGKVLALLLSAVAFVPSAVAFHKPRGHITPGSEITGEIFHQVVWVSLAIFLIVEVVLLYFVIKYRKRRNTPKDQRGPELHGNTKMEIAWTIGPALIMIWLLIISFNGLQAIDYGPTDGSEPEVYIDAIAGQFAWTFVYQDGSRVLADPGPGHTNRLEQIAPDEVPSNVLRFAADTWVQFNVTSTDVIHAFAVNEWDMIVDANPCSGDPLNGSVAEECPDTYNRVWTKVTEPGVYLIQCRQYCGVGHGMMTAVVEVFPRDAQARPYGPDEAEEGHEHDVGGPAGGEAVTNQEPLPLPEDFNGTVYDVALLDFDIVFEQDGSSVSPQFEPGERIAFQVSNGGNAPHNFFIGDFVADGEFTTLEDGQSATLQPGERDLVIVTMPEEDVALDYWCNIPGHVAAGMIGQAAVGDVELTGIGGPEPMLPGPGLAFVTIALVGAAAAAARRRD